MTGISSRLSEAKLGVEPEDVEELERTVVSIRSEYKDAAPTSAMMTYAVWELVEALRFVGGEIYAPDDSGSQAVKDFIGLALPEIWSGIPQARITAAIDEVIAKRLERGI